MAQDKVNHDSDSRDANYSNGVSDSSGFNNSAGANDSSTVNNPGRVSDSGGVNFPNSVSDSGGANYPNGLNDSGGANYSNGVNDPAGANYSNGLSDPAGASDPEVVNNFRMLSNPVDGNGHEFNMMNNGSSLQRPQHYVRQGPVESQLMRLYLDTGDSLQYGPMDPVDDFPAGSAFSEQAIEGDAVLAELAAASRGQNHLSGIDLGYPEGFIEGESASVPVATPSVYLGQAYRRNSERSADSSNTNRPWYWGTSSHRRLQGRGSWTQGALQQHQHHHGDRGEYQQGARRADMATRNLASAERSLFEDLEIIASFGNMNGVGGMHSSSNTTYNATVNGLPRVEDHFSYAPALATSYATGMAYTTAPASHVQATDTHMPNSRNLGPGFRDGNYYGPSGHAFRYMEGFEGMTNVEIRNMSYQTSVFDEDVHQPMPDHIRRQLQRQLQGGSSQDTSALRTAGGPSARFGDSSWQPATEGHSFNSRVQTHFSYGRQLSVQWYPGIRSSLLQPSSEMRNNVHVNGGYTNQEPAFNQSQSYADAVGMQYLREQIANEDIRIHMERLIAERHGSISPSAPRVSAASLSEARDQRDLTHGGLTAENLGLVNQRLAQHQTSLEADQGSDRSYLPGPHSDRSEEYHNSPH